MVLGRELITTDRRGSSLVARVSETTRLQLPVEPLAVRRIWDRSPLSPEVTAVAFDYIWSNESRLAHLCQAGSTHLWDGWVA